MAFEFDFLPVGDGKDGGDAICLRYGNLNGNRSDQNIIIIDGGYKKTGENLVEHINTYYRAENKSPNIIDLVILSHPDIDHASGLIEIFNNFKVSNLLMHRPWNYSDLLTNAFKDGRITSDSLEERLRKKLAPAHNLELAANKQDNPKCKIYNAYAGISFDNKALCILNPSEQYYISLIPQFEKAPEEKDQFKTIQKSASYVKEEIKMSTETWDDETLAEYFSAETTAENLSSTIIIFQFDNKKILFTADAGTQSFLNAMEYANNNNINLNNLDVIQVPHHGSKHNIGKKVLNRLIGRPQSKDNYVQHGFSLASVAKDSDIKHPSRKVTNAFLRRGYPVFQTRGKVLNWGFNAPERNWNKSESIKFFESVDED